MYKILMIYGFGIGMSLVQIHPFGFARSHIMNS